MVDENDLTDAAFGEPEDDVTALAGHAQPAVSQLAAESEVSVLAIEEVVTWPAASVTPPASLAPPLKPVQLALYAGWTMAVLYGTIFHARGSHPPELPTANELVPTERRKLELARLRHLLTWLLPDVASSASISAIPSGDDDQQERTRRSKLESLNLAILTALTAARPELQLAYELGRSLRDSANPPGDGPVSLGTQLERGRIAQLQEWLLTLSPEFPPLTAAVVAASIGRWSDLAAVTVDKSGTMQAPSRLPSLLRILGHSTQVPTAETMCAYLLRQGDVWLMLLTGELATSGLLTPEGYVSAGETALRRSGAIVRGVLRHYWFGLLCVAAALTGTLFLAARYLQGAGKVWTSIACIAGGLGISVQTIASTSARLAAEAERPVFAVAEEDAMAWAITTMPPLTLTFRSVRRLRRAGIAPTAGLGRF
ncbi:MAG: hypothetical protein WBH47_07315 [Streptosporangiaceae bacterium]